MQASNKYYVYMLCRGNGLPFYVGKGCRDRIGSHEVKAKKGVRSHVCNVIRKIWAEGGHVVAKKVYVGKTNQEAIQLERELISKYGRKDRGGILVNKTDGGDGAEGYRHDLVALANMRSSAQKRPPRSPETIEKMRLAMIGRKLSDEAKKKISASLSGERHWNYGKTISEQHKQALIASRRRKLIVEGVLYESFAAAAAALGISASTLHYRINVSQRDKYRYA